MVMDVFLASTLCKYDLRKGDLFVLILARVRRVRRGSLSSELKLYVSVYLIMYFQQFKWFLINLLLAICILRYALLLDVLIDICFVFTMYLINLADTNRRYSGFCF